MVAEPYSTKLAAVLYADAVDYSLMMGRNEVATRFATTQGVNIFRERVASLGGRVVNTAGDSLLAEFPSVVGAAKCAIEVQDRIAQSNAGSATQEKVMFRIGLHLGDIFADEQDIFGDCVNTVARLQQLAIPGGVVISRAVYDLIKNKMPWGYECLGTHALKNIVDPLEVFRIRPDRQGAILTPNIRPTSAELSLPSRPSIAVLPFDDMSGDRSYEYFADGFTEDIITSLSKFRELFVIARNSSFVFKGRAMPIQQVGRELGVRYVLEGSVRRADNRVRISAQLIDSTQGHHLWADSFDRDLIDLFNVQDDVARLIVSRLAHKVQTVELERHRRIETPDLEAYGCLLRGQAAFFQFTREGNIEARRLYELARKHDPGYARAFAALSRTYNEERRRSWGVDTEDQIEEATKLAKRSIELDASDPRGHAEMGYVHLYKKEHDLSVASFERALVLNPNDADVMAEFADALAYSGRAAEALDLMKSAMRLNPYYPDWYLWHLAGAQYLVKDYAGAIQSIHAMQNVTEGRRVLAASFAQLNLQEEAHQQARAILDADPGFSVSRWAEFQPDRIKQNLDHFVDGLLKAGLPK